MVGNFPACLAFTMRPENDGTGFHVDPDDTGGATKWGVTLPALIDWRRQNGCQSPTVTDLQNLSEFERNAIYACNYWMRVNADRLPLGVDLMVFDFGVTSGAPLSARALQHAAGLLAHDVDGWIGEETIAAVNKIAPFNLIATLSDAQSEYYKACATAWKYINGWERRLDDRRRLAVSMLTAKES